MYTYKNTKDCATALAENISDILCEAIKEQGYASLVVSGGSTPKPFFQALKTQNLPWDKLMITLADERWVDASSDKSNEKLVRDYLLHSETIFVGLKNETVSPEEGEAKCNAAIAAIKKPFDVVVLGMGADGHTASFFPNSCSQALYPTDDALCKAALSPDGVPRMTLTLPTLLNAKHVMIHITGEDKRIVYEKSCGDGIVENMPIRAVLHQKIVPVEVYWAP